MKSALKENQFSLLIEIACGVGLIVIYVLAAGGHTGPWPDFSAPLHTIFEFISVLISFMTFTLGWALYGRPGADRALLLAMAGLVVGMIDVAHLLTYPGMHSFFAGDSVDRTVYFWLAARWSEGLAILLVPLSLHFAWIRRLRPSVILAGILAWVAIWYLVIFMFGPWLPELVVEGQGLTRFKQLNEFSIIALQLAGAILFFRNAKGDHAASFRWMGTACLVMMMGESLFVVYQVPSDIFSLSGHIYKAIAALIMYRAVLLECVARPIENLSRNEIEVRTSMQVKSKFLAKASHELRSPLVVICGGIDLLLSSGQTEVGPTARRRLQAMERHANQLRWLVDDLLDLSKIEAGRFEVRPEKINMADFMQEILLGLQLMSDRKGLMLGWEIDANLPRVFCADPHRLRQLFDNVVGNAIKFTLEGRIDIKIEAINEADASAGSALKVFVADTGVGIDSRYVNDLFKPFSQGDPSTSRRFGGTGLGLNFSRELARLMGGDLWLERSEPGVGSTFVFTVRAASLENTTESPEGSSSSKPLTA